MNSLPAVWRGHLAMLAFSAVVAGSFSLGHRIANDIDPVALTVARFLIAAGLIGVLAAPRLRRIHARAPWRYLLLGGFLAAYFVLMFEGLKTASPVSTSALFTLTPIVSGLFGWWLLRQVTTPRMALALAIGGAGALWVVFRGDWQALAAFDIGRGEAIYFIGAVAHAVYTPLVRRLNRGEPTVVFTLGTLVAALCLLVLYGVPQLRAAEWSMLPARVWWVTLYLAVFASAGSFMLLQYAALRLPAAKVMAYTYLTPSWVILWELVQGRDAPPLLVLVGVVLSVLALVLLLKDETPEHRTSSEAVMRARRSA